MKLRWPIPASLALLVVFGPRAAAEESTSFAKDVLPFLTKHCYHCHGNGKKKGEIALDPFRDDESLQKDRTVWEKVLKMVRGGEMPPKERPRPAEAEVAAALKALDSVLAKFDCNGPRNVGRVTVRRLNRSEYNNTIRDLLGVDFQPAADFPNDDVGYGFDNIGDVLTLSPLLFEKYLSAAELILEQAVVNIDPPKPAKERLGGIRVSRDAGETRRGLAYLHSKGSISGESHFEEGDYIIRIEAYGQQVGDEPVKASLRVGFNTLKEFEIKADVKEPVTLEFKTRLRTGTSRISLNFLNPYKDEDEEDAEKAQRRLYVRSIVMDGPYNAPPPKVPEPQRRLMTRKFEAPPRDGAREIVSRFATRAFRRPIQPAEVDRLLRLYDEAEKAGERFEGGIRIALQGVLVSPSFLFRVELDPPNAKPGQAYPISEYELASRLSYFLWSSMPDDELFDLAAKGTLRQNLPAQVKRMVQDPKSAAFVQNFAGQWLLLRSLPNVSPDTKVFPNYDAELRAAMGRETELFFQALLREDRSILDFIDGDFTFVNERLAKHYGIDGVKGKEFQRVKAPPHRGGILTHASILSVTSNPTRTSPVKRGKWVLEQILNSPPPPPPPDVPPIDEEKQLTGSLRKIMEMHRENAVCASCHNRMDPIGFAFENFDAIGGWRDKDGKFAIDASGVLPDGRNFQGPAELKLILKEKKEMFGRCLAEKMLTYGLGRGLDYYDRCALDKIIKALGQNGYRFSTLLLEVVQSEPFQMRTAMGRKEQ